MNFRRSIVLYPGVEDVRHAFHLALRRFVTAAHLRSGTCLSRILSRCRPLSALLPQALISLHVWTAVQSYEVLGVFGEQRQSHLEFCDSQHYF